MANYSALPRNSIWSYGKAFELLASQTNREGEPASARIRGRRVSRSAVQEEQVRRRAEQRP
eukprot:633862-Hanusia_phi.AAC.1